MQWSTILADRDFPVSVVGLGKRQFGCKRDNTTQLGIELLQTREIEPGESLRTELSLLDPTRELGYRREGNVFIILGQRPRICLGPYKLLARRTGLFTRQYRAPARPGRKRGLQCHFPRSNPSLVERSHGAAPVAGRQSELVATQFHLYQFFSLGKGRRRHFRSNRWCG